MQHAAPRAPASAARSRARATIPSTYSAIAARPVPRAAGRARVAPLVEAEQLVGVAVLPVVVDQPRVRRRGDDAVVRPAEVELARVAVEDRATRPARAHARERLDPVERVERVAEEEPTRRLDRLAFAAVLVAPVRLELRLAREVEVEMRRPPRRAGSPRQDDPEHVGVPTCSTSARKWRSSSAAGGAYQARTYADASADSGHAARTPRPVRAPRGGRAGARRCCTGGS